MPINPSTKRLFFAIKLPPTIKKVLNIYQQELSKASPDVKWVEPENIHITLKFLDAVKLRNIEKIKEVTDKNFTKQKSFKTNLLNIGCFPSLQSPKILWAGFENKNTDLEKLAQALENTLEKLEFKKEAHEFQAHATLGRIRSRFNITALIEKINSLNQAFKPQELTIDNLTLFESTLTHQGPKYSAIHQINFK